MVLGQPLYDEIIRASQDPSRAQLYRPFFYRTRFVPRLDVLPARRRSPFTRLTEQLAAVAASLRLIRRPARAACCAC